MCITMLPVRQDGGSTSRVQCCDAACIGDVDTGMQWADVQDISEQTKAHLHI